MPADAAGVPHIQTEGKHHYQHAHDKLLGQVAEWLHAEKAKQAARKCKNRFSKEYEQPVIVKQETAGGMTSRPRTSSQSSDSSALSLERLQRILEDNMGSFGHDALPTISPSLTPRRLSQARTRKKSTGKKLGGFASSDTEYHDGDVVVPSTDAVLDNSKTMSYSGGAADSSSDIPTLSTSKRAEKERKAWLSFKSEILRLTHTLRLKGWRRIPLVNGGDIDVERLSGALTNAVYVVSPPKELPPISSAPIPSPTPRTQPTNTGRRTNSFFASMGLR